MRIQPEQKYANGSDVLVGGNLAGIVISAFYDNSAKKYMYRILVSAHDCIYRVYNNKISQNNLSDHYLLRDDIFSLKFHCEQYAHLEIYEGERLQTFNVVNELKKTPDDMFCMNESYGIENRCVLNCGECNNRKAGTEKMNENQ